MDLISRTANFFTYNFVTYWNDSKIFCFHAGSEKFTFCVDSFLWNAPKTREIQNFIHAWIYPLKINQWFENVLYLKEPDILLTMRQFSGKSCFPNSIFSTVTALMHVASQQWNAKSKEGHYS